MTNSTSPAGYVRCTISYADRKVQQFGSTTVTDAKGRKIGCQVVTDTVTCVERTDGVSGQLCRPNELGVRYAVVVQMTKDGKAWGASQGRKFFKTEAEATAYWSDKLAAKIAKNWK